MSNNKMLIDATHPEETRVVVLRNGRVEEFDYESAARKLLRGNIYLAKVTRVEPSLQAAFVDYGGNRHGFLAFNEIHPDYYQIPVADRELLKQEEAAAEAEAEAAAEERAERRARQQQERRLRRSKAGAAATAAAAKTAATGNAGKAGPAEGSAAAEAAAAAVQRAIGTSASTDDDVVRQDAATAAPSKADDAPHEIGLVEDQGIEQTEPGNNGAAGGAGNGNAVATAAASDDAAGPGADDLEADSSADESDLDGDDDTAADDDGTDGEPVEDVGSDDALEEIATRPRRRARQYKIQEVIKRRQVLLIQVVKEERGNKGAALTTYLSLAGRYTVLMPNTGRGGGISRKINNAQDRKRLKAIASELDVPEGMGLIIRTAGATRTKSEIQRDFEYLLRLWESVRELTLESSAPNLVYEEGNLIKRSIRDLYTKEIGEIHVAGETAYNEAREFMGMLMPAHAKNVIAYNEPQPLFAKHQIERQLNAMFSPYVTLKSGGYIVIDQTEALVSVDVNSGKSTREFSIEQTALNTNLEAAEELGRQLKLRDLAGLIVIDFIDMEERRNNRAVERKIKECLKNDRARIQISRISHFGLLEMSRQRMRTGVLEGSTTQCPHCTGTGTIRSTESVALAVLRGLEDALLSNSRHPLTAVTTATVGLYILNYKRAFINEMEERYGISITIEASERMQGANFSIEKTVAATQPRRRTQSTAVNMETGFEAQPANGAAESRGGRAGEGGRSNGGDGDQKKPRRRRRRRGGRGNRDNAETRAAEGSQDRRSDSIDAPPRTGPDSDRETAAAAGAAQAADSDGTQEAGDGGQQNQRRPRHRGRRGGKRNRERLDNGRTLAGGGQHGQSADDRANGAAAAASSATPASATPASTSPASIPGSGEQPDLGDLPALHGAAPQAVHGKAAPGKAVASAGEDGPAPNRSGGRNRRGRGSERTPAAKERQQTAATKADDGKTIDRKKTIDGKKDIDGEKDIDREQASAPAAATTTPTPATDAAAPDAAAPSEPTTTSPPTQRKGWWQRAFSSD